MADDPRLYLVKDLLWDHVKSPSLRHVRDGFAVHRLAQEILRKLDEENRVWRKWDGPREALLKSAMNCWIPVEALQEHLNQMGGPPLTTSDVAQRLRAFQDEDLSGPKGELKAGCVALYEQQKAEGTELPAIIGAIQEFVELGEERLRLEFQERYQRQREEVRLALEQRFLSGADCKWTPIGKSADLYCRRNGRAYKLSPTKDKMWKHHRIKSADDAGGVLIGKYRFRGDATKVVAETAYSPEPKR